MIRNTYEEINLKALENNVKKIINYYDEYKYYFGVVKADCYGLDGIKTVQSIINGGANYLTVATLEEALNIRESIKDIPILVFGYIPASYIDLCKEQNITITITSLLQVQEYKDINMNNLKVHLKINTGMNRLGISNCLDFNNVYQELVNKKAIIVGLYTHIYNASNKNDYANQVSKFKSITSDINIKNIPIVHIDASEALVNYPKEEFVNGCRLGIIMEGFTSNKDLELESVVTLKSEVIQINELNRGDTVGYNKAFKASRKTKVAVVSIGYADGIIRANTNRYVYINDMPYKIVGNICMDMLFVEVDDKVKVHDIVYIIKDNEHILNISKHLNTIPYEVLCNINKRVPRRYI